MSSISWRPSMRFGIVSCGVRKNTRRAYPVADGSAAIAGKSGAAGSRAGAPGATAWHSEHHRSANARPRRASARASSRPRPTTQTMSARKISLADAFLIFRPNLLLVSVSRPNYQTAGNRGERDRLASRPISARVQLQLTQVNGFEAHSSNLAVCSWRQPYGARCTMSVMIRSRIARSVG